MELTLVALLAAALFAGDNQDKPYWVKTWDGALTYQVERVPSPWGKSVQGWTVCDKNARRCTIFVTPNACDYDAVLAHELKHKDGFDHPDYSTNLLCPRTGFFQ